MSECENVKFDWNSRETKDNAAQLHSITDTIDSNKETITPPYPESNLMARL